MRHDIIYSYLFSHYVIAHKYLVVNIITSNDDLQPSTVILEKSPGGLIKTHDSESRGQEEAGRMRDEQVSYLHVAPL